ncbi:hypothetical protein ACFW15_18845, partial [Streptomyces sp. NPDC058953]
HLHLELGVLLTERHPVDPECDLDYVPRTARPRKLRTVLSVGSGFGGFQSAVVMTRSGGPTRAGTSGRT